MEKMGFLIQTFIFMLISNLFLDYTHNIYMLTYSLQTDTYPHTLHAHEQTSIYTNKKHTVNVVIYAGSQVHIFLW